MTLTQRAAGLKHGWRSGLEGRVCRELDALGAQYEYEGVTGEYQVPQRTARYTPDVILKNGIVVELKGRWVTADRQKIRLVATQHPDLDLRMVFSNPNARISKQSQTTYAQICERLNIPFAAKSIPEEWVQEPNSKKRWAAIEQFRRVGLATKH